MAQLIKAIALEAAYQRECARERHLWLGRTSFKPLVLPTRESFAKSMA